MTLSPILEKILDDARREAESIEARGGAEAGAVLAEAKKEASALQKRLVAKARERIGEDRKKELSAWRLKRARELLAERRSCLDDVFSGLAERLIPDSPDEYALLLVTLAGDSVTPGKAVLQVGRKDVERWGGSFAETALQVFREKYPGCETVLSAAPASFAFGLHVQQQGVVHNLSLEELVAAGREEIEGAVSKTLFAV